MVLRVCHIASGDLFAGAEVMIGHLVEGLASFGDLELRLILLNEGKLAERIREIGVPGLVLKERDHSLLSLGLALSKVFKARVPDIIHSHRYKENILAFLMSLRFPRVRLIATQHGMPEHHFGGGDLRSQFMRRIDRACLSHWFARLIVVSDEMRHRMVFQHNYPERKICTIHNGIQVPNSARGLAQGKSPFLVGSCGRLFPVKDYPFMVEVARKVLEEIPTARFVLAGDGPEAARIRNLVESLGGLEGRFSLLGHVDDMPAFYRSLDLFINTSFHEGIPMSVLEAMSYGVPVVAPAVGGIPEIIDDEVNGFLVGNRDADVFAAVCIRLTRDHDLRRAISKAARSKVEKEFSMEIMASRYRRLYYEISTPPDESPSGTAGDVHRGSGN